MPKRLDNLRRLYQGIPDPDGGWRLGPMERGLSALDSLDTQLIDGPNHRAKIEVHGDDCTAIANSIVKMLNEAKE